MNIIRGPTLIERTRSDMDSDEKQIEDMGNGLRDCLRAIVKLTETAIEFKKDKETLERCLQGVVQNG